MPPAPQLTLRPLPEVRLAVHQRSEQLDAARPTSTHLRTRKDGTTQLITRRSARSVCAGARSLMLEVLVPLTRAAAQRALSTPLLWDQLVTDTGVQVPRIEVNNEVLGRRSVVCGRTIRTYLAQLKAHGFIAGYKFRGREHCFYLWIHPAYVWKVPAEVGKTAFLAPSKAPAQGLFLGPNGNNFPHYEVPETPLETQKKKVVGVEKSAPGPSTGTPLLEPQGHRDGAGDAGQAAKSRHRGRAAARVDRMAPTPQLSAEQRQRARAEAFCVDFWVLARFLLYPHSRFTAQQERLTLTAIYDGVYAPALAGVPESRWEAIHRMQIARLHLVRQYRQRHPDCYLPLPYAEVIPGRGYFDAANAQGFAGSRLWLQRKITKAKWGRTALELTLERAETELRQRLALDRGERVQASDNAKRKDITALHWHWRTEVRRVGGEEGLYLYSAYLGMLGLDATLVQA